MVTGYDASTFAPSDKATREQVAVMLYRYAVAQGKDVSVEDADATLSAYKDADQVSDWAKEAMAWAVDNGIFGQGTDELWAKQNIQRLRGRHDRRALPSPRRCPRRKGIP